MSRGSYRLSSSSSSISNINTTEHRYRINHRRKSSDVAAASAAVQKFENSEMEFSLTQAAVAATAAAAAAAQANPNFFHFKQEFDLMAKNHLDLFTINNNNEIDGPKINRGDERKREQRCFQVSIIFLMLHTTLYLNIAKRFLLLWFCVAFALHLPCSNQFFGFDKIINGSKINCSLRFFCNSSPTHQTLYIHLLSMIYSS